MMSPQEFGDFFWGELERRLRASLAPAFRGNLVCFTLEDVLQLCRRQLEREELSSRCLEQAADTLPEDREALRARIDGDIAGIVQRVCGESHVEDCIQVTRFLTADSEGARNSIFLDYWRAYEDWAYGEDDSQGPARKRWGGVLGARLTAYLGRRDAESEFAAAKDELDARVFTLEKFAECVRAYRPGLGMKFENFFKQRIRLRAGDVARNIARKRCLLETEDLDATLLVPYSEPAPDAESPPVSETGYRACLEAFRQAHDNADLAARKVAAFELHYKAYLDPHGMLRCETLDLVSQHHSLLQIEFDTCQCQLRDLEEQLNTAESDCDRAWKAWLPARRKLAGERRSLGEVSRLEAEASTANKTELEQKLAALGAAGPSSRVGLALQYQICFNALAKARRSRERCWEQWKKWEQCRLPWVRSHQAIAELLCNSSQPTISRHLAEVKRAMRNCLDSGEHC